MEYKPFDDLSFGSELEKFILNHAALKPGDKLEGKIIQVKPNGKVLINFGKFRAAAETLLPIKEGEIIHVVVVTKRPKLKLRLEVPRSPISTISPGNQQLLNQLEIAPEDHWDNIRTELQKLLEIEGDALFPQGIREALEDSNKRQVKLKILSPLPLHLSLLLETERLGRVRIDFFLVLEERNLNITFFVMTEEAKENIKVHLVEVEENLKNRFQRLVLNVIVSARKVAEFDSENLDISQVSTKMLDVDA